MKKMITMAFIAVLMVGLVGCSKKDEGLMGTSWTFTSTDNVETITFSSETAAVASGTIPGGTYEIQGTYDYEKPKISLNFRGVKISGNVEENVMILSNGAGQNNVRYYKN